MHHPVMGYENLHRHSDFSIQDGFARVSEYAEYQKTINQKYLCITDHGVMGAIPQQIAESEKHNLFPLFGCEMYVNSMQPKVKNRSESAEYRKTLGDGSTEERTHKEELKKSPLQKKFDKSSHILGIAYSDVGYANLVRLTSWAWIHGYYRKPRVNHDVLMEYKEGIVFTSACGNSEIARAFFDHGDEAGFAVVEKYKAMFGEHFYLELMMLDWGMQKPYDAFLIRAHEKYGIPLILSQDCHYCKKEHSKNQRLMLMQQNNKTLAEIQSIIDSGEGEDLFELQDTNLWLKSEDELNFMWEFNFHDTIDYELFKQAKANTVKLAEFAKGVQIDREIKLPKIPDADAVLWDEIKKGFVQRLCPQTSEYSKRIREEYDLITEKGFASYFLIQKMMVDEARRKGPIVLGFGDGTDAVGPGRGCLDASTYIMRIDGQSTSISDFKIGDEVVTRDGSVRKVTNIFTYPLVNETMLCVKSFYGDHKGVTLTKDHEILVEKSIRPKNWDNWAESTKSSRRSWLEPTGDNLKWIPARDVSVGDWVFTPIPNIKTEPTTWDLSIYDKSFKSGKKLASSEEFVTHEFNGGPSFENKQLRVMKRQHKLDEHWAYILGCFTGDGWLAKEKQSVEFCFAVHEHKNRDWILKFFENIGCDVYAEYSKGEKLVDSIRVNNVHVHSLFTDLFDEYQFSSKTKHVPKCILNSDEKIVQSYLHGYFMADGREDDGKMKFVSVSFKLANQIRFLLLRLGIPSTLQIDDRKDERSEYSGRGIAYEVVCPLDDRICSRQFKKQYVWKRVEGGILTQVRSIEEVEGVEKVYDLEVEGNHNYLTSSFLVHNSVCGSLVAYCLRLHDVEPIIHDLKFSRFLSPARGGKQMKLRHTIEPSFR